MCRSALVTITFGLYPIAICASCSARWIQDGRQQRAINQIQEPSLFASAQGPSLSAQGPSLSAQGPSLSAQGPSLMAPPVAPSQASAQPPPSRALTIATPAPAS